MYNIRKAAVIGSGVMGAGIAALLANVGIKVALLDVVPKEITDEERKKGLTLNNKEVRNRIVLNARESMIDKKSTLLYQPENVNLISFGNIEDDLELLKEVDWVVEVVVENIEIKKNLFNKIMPFLNNRVLLSTNTSGISINDLSQVLQEGVKKRFFLTHFFNPVRYMKLLEIVPSIYTDKEVINYMKEFCENILGKGIVVAKDTPGFIANRFGTYACALVLKKAIEHNVSIEEVDILTAKEIGRPNTGTYRLYDLVGLDTALNLANYLKINVSNEQERNILSLPDYFEGMVKKGYLGDKVRQGFYKRVKDSKTDTMVIDLSTLEYRPKQKVENKTFNIAKKSKTLQEKIKTLINADGQTGDFVWDVIKNTLLFAASLIPEVSDDIESIDNSMKWGYNWELGPFELWDLIGVRESVERMKSEGAVIPPIVEEFLITEKESFYEKRAEQDNKVVTPFILLNQENHVLKNNVASLVDMGDGVACFIMHSRNNTVYDELINFSFEALAEVERNFIGMVIASSGNNFCVGGNLLNMLQRARDKKWDVLEKEVSDFQKMNMALKYFNKPIVSTPYGMTLGGGAEIVMHSSKARAFAETYMGLVEIGVGILPAGGGTKELLLKFTEGVSGDPSIDLTPFILKTNDLIASAKVSKSGPDAKTMGFLQKDDIIVMNKDLQLSRAKEDVLYMAETFIPKDPAKKYRVGGETTYTWIQHINYQKNQGDFISEYDRYLMNKIAYVLCGGKIRENSMVAEQKLLDLELEVFLSLAGEQKSQARMEHMLETGKALRN